MLITCADGLARQTGMDSGVAPFAVRESNQLSFETDDSSRRPESIQTASPTRLIYPSGNTPDLSTNARQCGICLYRTKPRGSVKTCPNCRGRSRRRAVGFTPDRNAKTKLRIPWRARCLRFECFTVPRSTPARLLPQPARRFCLRSTPSACTARSTGWRAA